MRIICRPCLPAICALLSMLLTACAADTLSGSAEAKSSGLAQNEKRSNQPHEMLVPLQMITGGQLAARVDVNGFPVPGAMQGFSSLVFPSALAVRGTDLYIADSGARKLYRFDTITQIMTIVPGIVAMNWTRMQVGTDLSLFVLDPLRVNILHYTRGMQPLQTLGDPSVSVSLDGFVIDEGLGSIIASDRLSQRLLMFSSLGGPALPLDSARAGEFRPLGALARAGRTVYAIDNACFCIAVLNESGSIIERIGKGVLNQPQALAADRHGYIFVSDAADRSLKVFLSGELVASVGVQKLHATEITALAVDENILYIADGPGSRVLSFRIQ